MLQRDLAGQYENWQVVKTKGQEDIDVSEEKATDAESTSVLWLQSSCCFWFCCLFARKLQIPVEPVRITYVMCTCYRVKGQKVTDSQREQICQSTSTKISSASEKGAEKDKIEPVPFLHRRSCCLLHFTASRRPLPEALERWILNIKCAHAAALSCKLRRSMSNVMGNLMLNGENESSRLLSKWNVDFWEEIGMKVVAA